MWKMRIANEHSVNLERKQGSKSPKQKYYIIPEGDETEIRYFKGIEQNRKFLNIKPLIEIVLIENEDDENGQSHPKWKIKNFENDLKEGKFDFYSEIDKVCFVVDRDPQNFKEKQLEEFINCCKEQGYDVYISNPTFEFFLLLHSDVVLELDKKEMLENKRHKRRGKRFLELKLFEIFGCKKTNIDFEKFKSYIKRAIKNEKSFCEDLEGLKDNLGSNVGKLLDSMME